MWQTSALVPHLKQHLSLRAHTGALTPSFYVRLLGCQVVVLLDLSYRSRFWTSYEAWLAHQQPTPEGFIVAEGDASRCEILPLLGARGGDGVTMRQIICEEMTSAAAGRSRAPLRDWDTERDTALSKTVISSLSAAVVTVVKDVGE